MKRSLIFYLTLLFLLFFTVHAYSTHIVGGVIYYEHLGGNRYKLIFEVYRDCSPGVVVGFDGSESNNPNQQLPPFYFSVFEGNVDFNIAQGSNALQLRNPLLDGRINPEKIRPVIVNPCLKIGNACVERGVYETEIELPKNDVGYTIQHMRCCRNDGILNIQNQTGNQDKPGFTLRTFIPPPGPTPNNSARFKELPPIFICVNQAFYFDHVATDKDGDVLEYSLTTPLAGLDSDNPTSRSQTLNVSPVRWSSGYSEANMMGGTPPLSIDPVTGQLVCKPNRLGRFVASVMVKEIRNGVVINSFARDFQYNVVDCDIPNADAPFIPGTYDPKNKIGTYILCSGDLKVDFVNTSTNADRYEWNFGDPASGTNNTSTQVNPSHTFSDSGIYTVVLRAFKRRSDGQLCFDTTRRICIVYPKLISDFSFQNQICAGSSVKFSDLTPLSSGPIVKWEWDFGNGQKSSLKNPIYTYINAGEFNVKLKVTTRAGCTSEIIKKIAVFPKPNIAALVPNGCIGQIMNLECQVTINSPSTISGYRWTLPNGTQFTSCNANYTPTSMASSSVNLWAISNFGCKDSMNFPFTVNPLPLIRAFGDTTLCYDQVATISAVGGISYEWTPPIYLSNANSASSIASPPYPDSIVYTVKGTDVNQCYNFDSVKIKFFTKTSINAGSDTSICLPPSINARDFVQLNGTGVFKSVYWLPAASLTNANTYTPIARPTSNTDYIFHGIDSNKCLIRDTIRVIVLDPNFNFILMDDTSICPRDTFQIFPHDQGAFSTYLWTSNPSSSSNISNPNIRTPVLKPLTTTEYTLRISNYCYTKSDMVKVGVFPLPIVGLIPLDSICFGESYQFTSALGHVDYTWTTNEPSFSNKKISNPTAKPKTSQTYILKVIDTNTCINTDSIRLLVHELPYLSVLNLPRYLCLGDTVSLTVVTKEKCDYLWSPRKSLSSDTAKTVKASPKETTWYKVRATNIHQCTWTDSFIIPVQLPIKPYAKGPVRICKGKFIDLYAEGGLYYLWKPPYNISDTLSRTPQVFPDSFFTYTAVISNDCFIDSIKVDVYVDSLPRVDLGKDTSIYRGQEITISAKTAVDKIEWFPKSELETNPFVKEIRVSPRDTTRYFVEATDSRGCVGRDSIYVFVYGKNVLLIPTGFSPNGDGINDEFKIAKHLNIRSISYFKVFNRWGEKVFSTTDINNGWDGIFDGESSPAGVYVWYVEAFTFDNERIIQSGNVTLLR